MTTKCSQFWLSLNIFRSLRWQDHHTSMGKCDQPCGGFKTWTDAFTAPREFVTLPVADSFDACVLMLKRSMESILSDLATADAFINRKSHQETDTMLNSSGSSQTENLSEKGSAPLRRGPKGIEIDSPPKGQPPFPMGSKPGRFGKRLLARLAVLGVACVVSQHARSRCRTVAANL